MCNAIRNGGNRCPVHQHQNIAAIKAASHLSGLTRLQTERLFAELRREGRNADPISNQLRAGSLRRIRNSVADTPVAADVNAELDRSAIHDEALDGSSAYAQRALLARARERANLLNNRFQEVATRTGLTTTEVAAKYKEFRDAVDTSRGSVAPAEYDQNTRRNAVIANLPYDRASVVALEKLNSLVVSDNERRVTLVPAPEASHIHSYGYDEGRLEVAFNSNPDNVYAYQNVPESTWERFSTASNPGVIYAREIRGNDEYTYESREAAEADATRIRCGSCGQFRASAHSCPAREVRVEMARAGLDAEEIQLLAHERAMVGDDEQRVYTDEEARVRYLELTRDMDAEEPVAVAVEPVAAPSLAEAEAEVAAEEAEAAAPAPRTPRPVAVPVTPAPEIAAQDLSAFEAEDAVVQDTGFTNQVGVDSQPLLASYVNDEAAQRTPAAYDRAALLIASAEGKEMLKIGNTVRHFAYSLRNLSEEAKAEIEAAPDHIYFVVAQDAGDDSASIISSYDSRVYTGKSESQYGNVPGQYGYTYGYKIHRRAKTFAAKIFTEEEKTAAVDAENATLVGLVDSGAAVRIPSTATETRKYTFDRNADKQPYMNFGNASAFKRAIKDNKVAIIPVSVRLSEGTGTTYVDDQGYSVSGNRGTTISGEIAVRRNASGAMEIISSERKLRCTCQQYRRNYHCQHVDYTHRHVVNAAQQMIPLPVSRVPGEAGPARHRLVSASLSNRGDVSVVAGVDGAADYLSFGSEVAGEVRTDRSYQAQSRYMLPEHLRPVDPDAITDDESAALYDYNQTIGNVNDISVPRSPAAIRSALNRSAVEVPVRVTFSEYINNRSSRVQVTGSMVIAQQTAGDLESVSTSSHTLKCTCAAYQANYDCPHVRVVASQPFAIVGTGGRSDAENFRYNTAINRYRSELDAESTAAEYRRAGLSNEAARIRAREELAARQVQRAEREERDRLSRIAREERYAADRRVEAERMASLNVGVIEDAKVYRERMMARWENPDESYATNPKQFYDDYKDTLSRKRAGEETIPFRTENVTDGICADEPGARQFGIELEFDIKRGVNRGEALRTIGRELKAAGLTDTERQVGYHSARSSGWNSWSFEEDCTVDAELVSPLMKDTPEHWAQLNTALEIINRNGGIATSRTGSHVHVSTASYELSTAKHAELLRTVNNNEDVMYRLASNPATGKHRGTRWCAPNTNDSANDVTDEVADGHQVLGYQHSSHGVALNLEGTSNTTYAKSNVEFRMWDGTLNPAVIQQQVAISAAITDYAERSIITNKVSKKPAAGDRSRIGTSKAKEETELAKINSRTHTEESFGESSKKASEFLDKLFRRKEDRAAAASLFAVTNWQQS